MRVEKRNGYRVVVGGPVPPQAEAITLGTTIFVRRRSCEHQGLMAHELVHVRQFKEMGPVRFLSPVSGFVSALPTQRVLAIWPPIGASL